MIRDVMIELDAKALVDVLNSPSYRNAVISPLLDDCTLLISQIPQVRVKHIYREANKCVDRLAKLGLFQSLDFTVHSNPPLELISLVERIPRVLVVTGSALSFLLAVSFNIISFRPKKKKKGLQMIML